VSELNDKIGQISEYFAAPVLFLNGKVNLMTPAPIFASFLILDKLLEEKKLQVETKPHGCVELTHIRPHGAEKLTAAQLAMQNGLNELLDNLTEAEIREELVSFAEEDPLTTTALLRLTNR